MKRIVIIFSVMMFVIANVGLSQDIVNETGTDGKFIVRDAEQQEAMVIEDGNVGITGELSVEQMPEGSVGNPYVVWDPSDKKFKTVARIFSKLSPLSEPLETRSWHSFSSDEVDEDGNLISASVQGVEAINWNRFDTDHGYIQLGPANTTFAHIYTDRSRFMFNKGVTFYTGEFGTAVGNDLKLQAGGVTRLLFKASNGFVGIGTTNPTSDLHLLGDLLVEDTYPFVDFLANTGGNQGLAFKESGGYKGWIYYNGTDGGIYIAARGIGYNPDIFARNNGNIGLGTITPNYKLDVNGTINAYGNSIFLRANTAEAAWWNGDYFSWGYDGNWNRFAKPVSIGSSTTAQAEMLTVITNAGTFGEVAKFENTNTGISADGIIIQTGPDANPGTGNEFIQFLDGNGTYIGAIEGDGAGGISWQDPSDRRLKMNIRDMNSGLDLIAKMKVKKYEMKSAPGIEKIGFIAQELAEVYPLAVGGDPNGDVEKEPMGVDAIALVPILVQAIQELQAEIEILKSK